MSKRSEKFLMRIEKGALSPADQYTVDRLRAKGYRVGDVVAVQIRKTRSVKFHRLMHAFGKVCAENIDDFEGMGAHQVLKRIQLEAGICCDEMLLRTDSGVQFVHRIPQSMSFVDMDDGQAHEMFRQMCEFIRRKYWPELDDGAVEAMAELMMEQAA